MTANTEWSRSKLRLPRFASRSSSSSTWPSGLMKLPDGVVGVQTWTKWDWIGVNQGDAPQNQKKRLWWVRLHADDKDTHVPLDFPEKVICHMLHQVSVKQLGRCFCQTGLTKNVGLPTVVLAEWNDTMTEKHLGDLEAAMHMQVNFPQKVICHMLHQVSVKQLGRCFCQTGLTKNVGLPTVVLAEWNDTMTEKHLGDLEAAMHMPVNFPQKVICHMLHQVSVKQLGRCFCQTGLTKNVGLPTVVLAEWNDTMTEKHLGDLEAAMHMPVNFPEKVIRHMLHHVSVKQLGRCFCQTGLTKNVGLPTVVLAEWNDTMTEKHLGDLEAAMHMPVNFPQKVICHMLHHVSVKQLGRCFCQTDLTKNVGLPTVVLAEWNDTMTEKHLGDLEAAAKQKLLGTAYAKSTLLSSKPWRDQTLHWQSHHTISSYFSILPWCQSLLLVVYWVFPCKNPQCLSVC